MNAAFFLYRLRRLSASLVGIVFTLAGLFKLLDPVGASLVMEEYFKFLHIPFLAFAAEPAAVGLALVESLLGAALVSGVFRKPVAWTVSVMVAFFTVLTLFLAVSNPPMDCGCFGEVVHLTNFQTFLKNVVLLALVLIAFAPYRNFGKAKKRKYWSFGIAASGVLAMTAYSLVFLPLVDHTEFSPGCELFSEEEGTAVEDEDDYISTFVYEKDGQLGSFTLDRLPDSTWTFVRTETILRNGPELRHGRPHLPFTDAEGNYQDHKALEGDVVVVSVHDPSRLSSLDWSRIGELLVNAPSVGLKPLILVASTPQVFSASVRDAAESAYEGGLEAAVHFADRRTLLALNRSNGGAVWFNDGQLVRKFHRRSLPYRSESLSAMVAEDPVEAMLDNSLKGRLAFQATLLYIFAILLII